MQLAMDPISGQIGFSMEFARTECEAFELAAVVDELPSREREVVRRLYGIGCAQLEPETVAEILGLSAIEVWLAAERAFAFVGQSVILGAAA